MLIIHLQVHYITSTIIISILRYYEHLHCVFMFTVISRTSKDVILIVLIDYFNVNLFTTIGM